MRHNPSSGFSLLELLAVVTITGIVAGLVLPRVSIQGWTAKSRVCDQYVSDLNSAIERYYFDNETYPAALEDLVPEYYPDAIPVCPNAGVWYSIDPVTHTIERHVH